MKSAAEIDVVYAYYYSFDLTGEPAIDAILTAVARAGKRYHSTSQWSDSDDGEPSMVEQIQVAADKAALAITTARREGAEAMREKAAREAASLIIEYSALDESDGRPERERIAARIRALSMEEG